MTATATPPGPTPTELRQSTTLDTVTLRDVEADTPDAALKDAARAYVEETTGYPSRDLGASINRYPATASAVVILWKD